MEDKEKKVLKGKKPNIIPPRVSDFEELEKKSIDTLVDAIKYIAASAGVIMAIYSQVIQDYLKASNSSLESTGKFLLFFPLLVWFVSIVSSVIGIYPRSYKAVTDAEKEAAVISVRNSKSRWLITSVVLFLVGFLGFLYIISAQIWQFYPFVKSA